MNLKLTEETTRVITYAKRFADSSGNRMISTEYLLAGIAAVPGPAADSMERNGANLEVLAAELNFDDSVIEDERENFEIEEGLRLLRLESKRLFNDAMEVSRRIGEALRAAAPDAYELDLARRMKIL